jgi:hypothetical protein
MCFSLQVLFGRNTLLIIPPPTNITKKFENWLNEINKKNKAGIKIRIQLCVGRYGSTEIKQYCVHKDRRFQISCRSFILVRTGSRYDDSYS